MREVLTLVQIAVGALLGVLILVQVKGTGFGRVWGGSQSFTRRGLEKLVFRLTFVVSGIFILLSVISLIIQ